MLQSCSWGYYNRIPNQQSGSGPETRLHGRRPTQVTVMKTVPNENLSQYDEARAEGFLQSYEGLVDDIRWLADEWPEMSEEEHTLQRSALMPWWEKRTILGALYRAGRLADPQVKRLSTLDQHLLEQAADVELAYGPTLGEMLRYLFSVGTPLADWPAIVHIETTTSALARLIGVETTSPAVLQPA